MAITDKKKGVWDTWEVYNKANEGNWTFTPDPVNAFTWGRNGFSPGVLGLNSSGDDRSSPTQIPGSSDATGYLWVANDSYSQHWVKSDGTLWGAGSTMFGMLGNNTGSGDQSSPVQIGTDSDWAKCFGLELNSFALKTGGELYAWGNNNTGQCGQNNTTRYSAPVQIPGDWTDCDVKGGYRRTQILKADGTLWVMGDGGNGRLGTNQSAQYSSPKQLPGTWTAHGTGSNQGYGVKSGTLYGWGNGQGYALSDSQTSYSSPKEMPGTGWGGEISGFRYGGLAIRTNGTLWGWGAQENDRQGTLGLNDTTNYTSIQPVGTDTTWANVITSQNGCTAALKTDGTLWCWGAGAYGMTAQNDTVKRSSPCQVPGSWTRLSSMSSSCQNQGALA